MAYEPRGGKALDIMNFFVDSNREYCSSRKGTGGSGANAHGGKSAVFLQLKYASSSLGMQLRIMQGTPPSYISSPSLQGAVKTECAENHQDKIYRNLLAILRLEHEVYLV